MALPAPNLDDRTFQDIVDEAKRLIPRYTPEWTNHNLSDPGVALIELFAWMSETVLYRLNQVPDKLFVHFLNLVGIDPFPPSVATVPLTFWLSAVQPNPVTVPAGMQVATSAESGETAVVFTTVADLVISQPVFKAAATTDVAGERIVDVTEDLRFPGSDVQCFTTPGRDGRLVPGDAVLFGFEASLAGTALRLTFDARAEGLGVDPGMVLGAYEDPLGGLERRGVDSDRCLLGFHRRVEPGR